MNITLNKDSWHFKIYSMVFKDKTPKSLCPYFWSMAAIITFSPVILFFRLIPIIMRFLTDLFSPKEKPAKKPIFEMTDEEIKKDIEDLKRREKAAEITGKIAIGIFLLFLLGLLSLSLYFVVKKDGWYSLIRFLFTLIGIGTTIVWIISGILKHGDKIRNLNVIKIPSAMIKAIYTKTCPIINWK
jgi:hypothetical protein